MAVAVRGAWRWRGPGGGGAQERRAPAPAPALAAMAALLARGPTRPQAPGSMAQQVYRRGQESGQQSRQRAVDSGHGDAQRQYTFHITYIED
jgi:hypothetical protein